MDTPLPTDRTVDVETPLADRVEQAIDLVDAEASPDVTELPLEVNEADLAEQAITVPYDEDDAPR